jgi:hypothetical protein
VRSWYLMTSAAFRLMGSARSLAAPGGEMGEFGVEGNAVFPGLYGVQTGAHSAHSCFSPKEPHRGLRATTAVATSPQRAGDLLVKREVCPHIA